MSKGKQRSVPAAGVESDVAPLSLKFSREVADEIERQRHRRSARMPSQWPGADGSTVSSVTRWTRMETWTEWEAALLVCGVDPSTYQEALYGQMIPHATGLCGGKLQGRDQFGEARRIRDELGRRLNGQGRVTPAGFVHWCEKHRIDVAWLREIANTARVRFQPRSRSAEADRMVLDALEHLQMSPRCLPRTSTGKTGPKRAAWDALTGTSGITKSVFDHAWKRLRRMGDIAEEGGPPRP